MYRAPTESVLGNPNVTWEKSTKTNIGFEANLLRDKVSITFDHFIENRKDILIQKRNHTRHCSSHPCHLTI